MRSFRSRRDSAVDNGEGWRNKSRMESSIRRHPEDPPFVMERIRRALENRDAEALTELYTEDAIIEEVSNLHPPAHPVIVQGRKAILERLRDDFSVDAVGGWHRRVQSTAIIDEMETRDAIAFTEVRTYAAGDKVVTQHIAHKVNGLLSHDRLVIARDSE
jgi:ketosteroid isomerase-like protein